MSVAGVGPGGPAGAGEFAAPGAGGLACASGKDVGGVSAAAMAVEDKITCGARVGAGVAGVLLDAQPAMPSNNNKPTTFILCFTVAG